jgi:hypothetical protein
VFLHAPFKNHQDRERKRGHGKIALSNPSVKINSMKTEGKTTKPGTMRKFALQLYGSMQEDLQVCRQKGFVLEEEIESCFQICTNYWYRLREVLSTFRFDSEAEEIDFFKNIKPLFSAEIEYYNLLYHACLFMPVFDRQEQNEFWRREATRLERFIEANAEFCKYYESKDSEKDHFYFVRKSCNHYDQEHILGKEIRTSTEADSLLATFLALQKYMRYIRGLMDELNKDASGN